MAGQYRNPNRNKITREAVAALLDYDGESGLFIWRVQVSNRVKPGDIAGCVYRGRRTIRVFGCHHPASNVAWLLTYGEWPLCEVDHEDQDSLNDKIKNLRLATSSQNVMNQPAKVTNKFGLKGVYKHPQQKGYWAKIQAGGVRYDLGVYPEPEMAAAAYRIAAAGIHGKFSGVRCA